MPLLPGLLFRDLFLLPFLRGSRRGERRATRDLTLLSDQCLVA